MKPSHGRFALRASARLTLAAIAATTFSLPSFAAEHDLDTMTVTTNRMPSENLLAPTTVITRADIERLQINDLPTLLSRQPGIDMSASGGLGKTSNIYMRGTEAGHTLILVDGVRWRSATKGQSAIQHFPVEQIERIEIVRGSRAGLYGSEAIGGVIQIFTRQGQQGLNPFAKVSVGTHSTKQAAAGISGGNERTTFNVSFDHESTAGIHAREVKNPDHDGYRNNSVSAKVNHEFNDTFKVAANFFRADGKNDYDGFTTSADYHGESVQQVLGVDADWKINDVWSLSMQLNESRDNLQDFKNGSSSSVFNTRYWFTNITNTFVLNPNHILNVGFDYGVDDVDSTTDYGEDSRYNRAVFMSWQGNADKHSWLLSARHDNDQAFSTHNTGTAEWGYWLQDNLQFTANAGTAFRAPTFNELYFPGFGTVTNQPEESINIGIGLSGDHAGISWSINAYKNKIKNLIAGFPAVNINKAKIKGVEFDATTTFVGWDVSANISILKPEDDETGTILPERARRLANLHIDRDWGKWSTGASWKLRGKSYDDIDFDAVSDKSLGGYGLVDLRVAYRVAKDWSLQANVSNLFDKEYQTNDGYNSLDRVAMFTILYQPK